MGAYDWEPPQTAPLQHAGQADSPVGAEPARSPIADALLRRKIRRRRMQRLAGDGNDALSSGASRQGSHRFGGDAKLERIFAGAATLAKGDRGLAVTKLQQALVELDYELVVDGAFGEATEAALKSFQTAAALADSGILDGATLTALDKRFATRKPYVDNAAFDPMDPRAGGRALSGDDKRAARAAMVPGQGTDGAPPAFQEVVAGKSYGDEMRARLARIIDAAHQRLYAEKAPLRADPERNLERWDVLEQTAEASKQATDSVYGSYAKGPRIEHATGKLRDQWNDEVADSLTRSPEENRTAAAKKLWYFIVVNCSELNALHSAVPSSARARAILGPIVEEFVDSPAIVEKLLEIEIGWRGTQGEGSIYVQRLKEATAAGNRKRLWKLFHLCIHEYLHSLTHPRYRQYALSLRSRGDEVRYSTLIEGFCDFFAQNVNQTIAISPALRRAVEGPYHDATLPAPPRETSAYASAAQAEQVISIVGVRNAQSAYFHGKVEGIGGP